MAILVAKLILIKCETEHGKHIKEEFSFIKKDPLRSCATCIDYVEGLSDWEINLLKDTGFVMSDRHLLASNIRSMAMAASKY